MMIIIISLILRPFLYKNAQKRIPLHCQWIDVSVQIVI